MFCKIDHFNRELQTKNKVRVKNKNKCGLLLFFPCLIAGFFVFAKNTIAVTNHLLITEVQIADKLSTNHDFIEIYNPTDSIINLKGYRLVKRSDKITSPETSIKSWDSDAFINPESYILWAFNSSADNFANMLKADFWTGSIISPKNGIAIRLGKENEGTIIDSVGWGADCKNIFCDNPFIDVIDDTHTINRKMADGEFIDTNNDSADFVLGIPSPKKETVEIAMPEPKIYSNNITLNEILPYPSNGDNEFIELYNPSTENSDLSAWILRDGSKTGKYIFPADTTILAQDYLVVYKKDFKFALNNSGLESVMLYNPEEKIISTLTYTSAKKDISYNFDGSSWRWSKFLTPGAINIFNNLPTSKTEVPKKIYKNTYADFSAAGADEDNDNLKYTWDFGDGHKSYLPETHHKYEKTGNYAVTLKIFDGSEEDLKTFEVAVENFPALDVNIIGLSPNPAGADTDVEYILLKNATKKKINLNGWSIATASKKDFTNHPINLDLILKPKQEFKLTHLYSKFSLNNTSAKIELRYPNGKVASKTSYKSPVKSIPDDATYEKIKGGWTWKFPIIKSKNPTAVASIEPSIEASIQQPPEKTAEQLEQELEAAKNLGNFSPTPEIENKKQTKFSLLNFGLHITTVKAFSETVSISNHTKTQDSPICKHWLTQLCDNLFFKFNFWLNGVL
jgi:hypothetical protein